MVKDLLILGSNSPEMELLRTRLVRMGYRALPAKEPHQAQSVLRVAGTRIGAVIVPSELPAVNLRLALDAMRGMVPGGELAFIGAGHDPGLSGRNKLREAGVSFAAFDPIDPHTLRFQVNRALADAKVQTARRRRTLRAPVDWTVAIRGGAREKRGRLYTVSASGAYVAIDQPSMLRSSVTLDLSLPGERHLTVAGRVAMTNVPGNMQRKNLPFGMGVQFDQVTEAASVALLVYAEDRLKALAI